MSRMPRELDPEWFWRARFLAAAWKVPILIGVGIFYGLIWVYFQLGEITMTERIISFFCGVIIIGCLVLLLREYLE